MLSLGSDTHHQSFFKREQISFLSALFALCMAGSSLTGWIFDYPLLKSFSSKLPAMIPMTASSVLLLAVSLLFLAAYQKRPSSRFCSRASVGFAAISLFLGGVVLLGHIFQFDAGLNRLYNFQGLGAAQQNMTFGGNMSIQTSLLSVLMGGALVLRPLRLNDREGFLVQILPMITVALSLLAVVAYIHDITSAAGSTKLIGLSLPAALGFLTLAFGTLAAERNTGFMLRLRSRRSDGVFMRWYTSFSIGAPLIITVLITWGENQAFYPPAFSASLYVVLTIISLFVLGVLLSRAIERLEKQRLTFEQAQSRAALQESEESLRETKDRLEIALAASKMGTWESNLQDDSAYLSEMAERLFGLDAAKAGRKLNSYLDGVHPEDLEIVMARRKDAIENHRDLDVDFRCLWPNGSMRWLRAKGRVKYANDGTPLRMGGTVMDITDEKSHQNAMETALRAAESANQLKTTFLTNMSHEIRTPLGAILGFTDLLRDGKATAEEEQNYLDVISRNGKTLSQLLNDILDLSKVESGYLNVEMLEFSLSDLVDEVIGLLKISAEEKGISLKAELAPRLPRQIGSDPVRLKQILINLIGNAIKFTSSGGVIVRVRAENSKIIFEIEDSGIGIEAEKQSKLFQAFSQADDSTTRRFGGTGLGLLLSRRLASLLGGLVELKWSEPGVGSVFTASIENKQKIAPSLKGIERGSLGVRPLNGVRVLVAEDSIDNQNLILRLLGREGAEVKMTNDGQECVTEALAHDYDIILMDIQMPVCDGYSATEKLRATKYSKPIVALTAHAMNDVRERCEKVGCNAHLTKPIDKALLIQTILNLTGPVTTQIV